MKDFLNDCGGWSGLAFIIVAMVLMAASFLAIASLFIYGDL